MQLSARRVRYKWQQFKANCQLDDAPRCDVQRVNVLGSCQFSHAPFYTFATREQVGSTARRVLLPPLPLAPTELCLARNSALTTIRAGKGWGKQRDRVWVWELWGLWHAQNIRIFNGTAGVWDGEYWKYSLPQMLHDIWLMCALDSRTEVQKYKAQTHTHTYQACICIYTIYSYGSRTISAVVALRVHYPRVIFNVDSYLVSAFRVKASLIAQTRQSIAGYRRVYWMGCVKR